MPLTVLYNVCSLSSCSVDKTILEADEDKEFGLIDEVFDRRPDQGEDGTTGAADITPV